MKREHPPGDEATRLSRRSFLKGASGAAAGGVLANGIANARPVKKGQGSDSVETLAGQVEVRFQLNGEDVSVAVEPRTTLLSALRDRVGHTAAKAVCERGNCGACTVLLDDAPVYSCLTLAVRAEGRKIRTAGGLADGEEMSSVQQALCTEDGMMCGFCTPGFVMSITACLEKNPKASEAEVRAACSGNLCRCGTYPHVFAAALDAGRKMANKDNASSGQPGGGR